METTKINLGDEVRDTITGFKGIAIARSMWLTGCDRITIQPKGLDKDGKVFDQCTFDIGTVEVLKTAKKPPEKKTTGGPQKEIRKYSI